MSGLPVKKSPGMDKIPSEVLRKALMYLLGWLTRFVNSILALYSVPVSLKAEPHTLD